MAEYPLHLARRRALADGRTVTIRPIRADDEMQTRDFFGHLSAESRQMRFMKYVKALSDKMIHFFVDIDYAKHMAFVCEAEVDGRPTLVGETRYVANPDGRSCEFGVVIADDWHGSGIAGLLMEALRFVRALGFELEPQPYEPTLVRAVKKLRSTSAASARSAGDISTG